MGLPVSHEVLLSSEFAFLCVYSNSGQPVRSGTLSRRTSYSKWTDYVMSAVLRDMAAVERAARALGS